VFRSRGAQVARRVIAVALALAALAAMAAPAGLGWSAAAPPDSAADDVALPQLEPFDNGGSRLLYLYLRGAALHEMGRFQLSNQAFDRADALLEDLYTRSLTRELGSLLTSDNLVEYRGERHEAALLHYYTIMNYLRLGRTDEAAVECRRLNRKLQRYADAKDGTYSDDPFLHYLTGLVYAASGDVVDADVSLRAAMEGFGKLDATDGVAAPPRLPCDRAAVAGRLGNRAEAGALRRQGGCPSSAPDSGVGTLRLFLECGDAPYRRPESLVLPIYREEIRDDLDERAFTNELVKRRGRAEDRRAELEYLLKVALPGLVVPPRAIGGVRVYAVAGGKALPAPLPAVCVEDVSRHARRAFEDGEGRTLLRATARALAKYLAKRRAEKSGGRGAGLVANLAAVATEAADLRCWSTLPDRILLCQADLPAGRYRLDVLVTDRDGRRRRIVRIPEVVIRGGRTTFFNHRIR
jgi:hypothetical protein